MKKRSQEEYVRESEQQDLKLKIIQAIGITKEINRLSFNNLKTEKLNIKEKDERANFREIKKILNITRKPLPSDRTLRRKLRKCIDEKLIQIVAICHPTKR